MEIRQYINFFRKWLWMVVLGAVVCGGASYMVSINLPKSYQSSVTLLVQQASSSYGTQYTDLLTSQNLAKTYGEMLKKRPVVEDVIQKLGLGTTPEKLAEQVDVELVRDTQLILVKVTDGDPARAKAIADQMGKSFIATVDSLQSTNLNSARGELQKQIDDIKAQIDSETAQLEKLRGDAASNGSDPVVAGELGVLQSQLSQDQLTYANLLKNYQELDMAQSRTSNSVTVVEPAAIPSEPVAPRIMVNSALAAFIGLILGIGIAVLLEYLDDTIKINEDVTRALALPALASIARVRGMKEYGRALFAHNNPKAPIAEAYRMLRTNVQFSSLDKPMNTLLVTSTNPGEGKSVTAANLGVVFAQAGKRVILIDSDLRRPTQQKLFNTDNARGLTTLLLDDQPDVSSVVRQTPVNNLRLITSGPIPPSPSEILGSQRMEALIKYLKTQADILIFDSPPVLAVTDSSVLASRMSGAILVVDSGATRRQAALQAVQALRNVGCDILGVVLNKIPSKSEGYYYSHYYGQEEDTARQEIAAKVHAQRHEAPAG